MLPAYAAKVFQLSVAELPSRAAKAGQGFDAWQLLRFGDAVLSWMKSHGKARPGQHLRFSYDPMEETISAAIVVEGDGFPLRLGQCLQTSKE